MEGREEEEAENGGYIMLRKWYDELGKGRIGERAPPKGHKNHSPHA